MWCTLRELLLEPEASALRARLLKTPLRHQPSSTALNHDSERLLFPQVDAAGPFFFLLGSLASRRTALRRVDLI